MVCTSRRRLREHLLVGKGLVVGRALGIAGAVMLTGTLAGCVAVGPDPSTVAPIALQVEGDELLIAFCEKSEVKKIIVEQRVLEEGQLGPWVRVIELEVGKTVEPLETVRLSDGGSAEPATNWINIDLGTQIYVGIQDRDGGGYSGQFESPGEAWLPSLWLPTQGAPTPEPCTFWSGLTGAPDS